MCTGFFSVEAFPSPKAHFHAVGNPVLWSVKLIVRGMLPEEGDVEKLVTGAANTLETAIQPVLVNVLLPFALLAVNITGYSPDLLYLCTGFFSVEVFPSPKAHFHAVGDSVLWSVKRIARGVLPEVGDAEKLVIGAFKTFETEI
jgi:hypothetical protein